MNLKHPPCSPSCWCELFSHSRWLCGNFPSTISNILTINIGENRKSVNVKPPEFLQRYKSETWVLHPVTDAHRFSRDAVCFYSVWSLNWNVSRLCFDWPSGPADWDLAHFSRRSSDALRSVFSVENAAQSRNWTGTSAVSLLNFNLCLLGARHIYLKYSNKCLKSLYKTIVEQQWLWGLQIRPNVHLNRVYREQQQGPCGLHMAQMDFLLARLTCSRSAAVVSRNAKTPVSNVRECEHWF